MNEESTDQPVEMHWAFFLEADNIEPLRKLNDMLGDEFELRLDEFTEVIEDGVSKKGPPSLSVQMNAALTPADVASLEERLKALAAQVGARYVDTASFDASGLDSWQDLDSACWLLSHYTDTGLEEGAYVPWLFGFEAQESHLMQLQDAIVQAELATTEDMLLREGDGLPQLEVFVKGENVEEALPERYKALEALAATLQVTMLGVLFTELDDEQDDEQDDESE
ncbi:MAG: hypothetical protein KF838_14095 [Phycisphaeraceae bacterium]|nr:MAG: hypothetical protein KF838_14095 [Phycisphaeraceae bacterium]